MITLWLPLLFPVNDWYCSPCIVTTVILLLDHTLKVCYFIKGGMLQWQLKGDHRYIDFLIIALAFKAVPIFPLRLSGM